MASRFVRLLSQSYDASTSPEQIQRLCSSWLLPSWLLVALRGLISIYAFAVLFTRIGLETTRGNSEDAQQSFSFFTVLCYWGIAFYFAIAALHTAIQARNDKSWLESWPGWLRFLHSALYMTITVNAFVVTAVFWAVLSEGAFLSELSTWSNISQHALNSVFAFLEMLLPQSNPHPWILLLPLVVVLALYLALAYLSHATEHFYVYSFLNPANGRGLVAGACIGILAGSIIVFVVVRYLMLLRRWATENGKLPKRFKSSQQHDGEVEMKTAYKGTDTGDGSFERV